MAGQWERGLCSSDLTGASHFFAQHQGFLTVLLLAVRNRNSIWGKDVSQV